MGHDVFISYSSKDKPTADAVCATLEGNGLRCWIAPRDILPGMDWGESIIDGIKRSRVMVLVFSSNANASHQIRREVERAVNKGVPIIPFRIEEVLPARSLEYFISTPHWMDAMSPPLEKHLEKLADVVKTLLSKFEDRSTRTVAGWIPPPVAKAARWLDTTVFKGKVSLGALQEKWRARKDKPRREVWLGVLLAGSLLVALAALLPLPRASAPGEMKAEAQDAPSPSELPRAREQVAQGEEGPAPIPKKRLSPTRRPAPAASDAKASAPANRPPARVSQVFECRRGAEFHVSPEEAVVSIDGRRLGIADDWDGSAGGRVYYFRGSGTYYARFSLRGYRTTWIKIVVRPGAEEEVVDVDTSLPELR